MTQLTPGAQKIQRFLEEKGYSFRVLELPESTRTSQEAASSIGCTVGQIAKSLIFEGVESHQPILIIASGFHRVDEEKVSKLIGEQLKKADADFVYEKTGFVIGGIPPVGHAQPVKTFIDEDLMTFSDIWAAAGSPHAVFKLTPDELVKLTGGNIIPIE